MRSASWAELGLRKPTNGDLACRAPATTGHVPAKTPRNDANSRRRIGTHRYRREGSCKIAGFGAVAREMAASAAGTNPKCGRSAGTSVVVAIADPMRRWRDYRF